MVVEAERLETRTMDEFRYPLEQRSDLSLPTMFQHRDA